MNNTKRCITLLKEYFDSQEIKNIANVELPSDITIGTQEWLYFIFYSCLLNYME